MRNHAINFALGFLEGSLKDLFGPEVEKTPKIGTHWRKFCAWVKKHQLCGTDVQVKFYNDFHNANQRPDQSPREFLDYLELIAAEIGLSLSGYSVFPRLQPKLRTELERVGNTSDDLDSLITSAERIWRTFKDNDQRPERTGNRDNPRHPKSSPSQPSSSSPRNPKPAAEKDSKKNPLTDEEKQTLKKEGRCFYCREIGHRFWECPKSKERKRKNEDNDENWSSKRAKMDLKDQGS